MTDPEVYRLIMLKYALRLEESGMKHSGGAIRPRIAAELGLKPREPRARFVEMLNRKIDAEKAIRENPGAQCAQ